MAIELNELISQLRQELTKAMDAGRDEPLRFGLGQVQLDLVVRVDKSASTAGKVKFWLVEGSADGRITSADEHKISIVLEPELVDPSRPSTVRPFVTGPAEPGER